MFETGTATSYIDLLDKLDTFLTAKGSAFGLAYSGTGDGTFTDYSGGASSVAETFTITATSSSSFDVVGSVSGSIGPATVGTPFAHAKIEFTITAGGTAFQAGDEFTISTAPKWTQLRRAKGCKVTAHAGNDGHYGAQNVVDGKTVIDGTNQWDIPSGEESSDGWLEFEFYEAEEFDSYSVSVDNTGFPTDLTLQYWTGSAWSDIDDRSGLSWSQYETKRFDIQTPTSATKLRLVIHRDTYDLDALCRVEFYRETTDLWPASFGQVAWQAPGNDGTREIIVGVHTFERLAEDYYDWEIHGFDAWNEDARFLQQAGQHGRAFMPLWDGSIYYWFIADGQRCVVVAKIGTQFETCFFGLIDPYFSPDQHPYPLAIGGSLALEWDAGAVYWDDSRFRYSDTTFAHSAFPMPNIPSGIAPIENVNCQLQLRRQDGVWVGFEAYYEDSQGTYITAERHIVWPYRSQFSLLDVNIDGSYALWPIFMNEGSPNTWGQLPGVFMVTGQGLSAEALITIGAIDYMAVPNVFRTGREDFFAVALD